MGTSHTPELQNWSLTTSDTLVSYLEHPLWGVGVPSAGLYSQHILNHTDRAVKWKSKITNQQRCAVGVWISKEEGSREIKKLGIILLLSTENQISFKILSWCLTSFQSRNNCIITSVQVRGIPGETECLEHTWGGHTALERSKRG